MEKCLFCDCDLNPGSEEHLFLSALGGRVATHRATCAQCNNAFASEATGKVDDALADGFKDVRNGLKVWSGRNGAPPTLVKAGTLPDGGEFDLAPGFIPVMRPGRIPDTSQLTPGSELVLTARDVADAKRMLDILAKRGLTATAGRATSVQTKVPTVLRSSSFDGLKVWRTVGKTAVVAFVVLYGNEQARRFVTNELRAAIRYGNPPINNFVGWDFTNESPEVIALQPHDRTPDAQPSGFEHSVVIADVQSHSVAYVTLFGGWRFSTVLGPKTGLPTRGLAVNPRSLKPARFIVTAHAPGSYVQKNPDSFSAEHAHVLAGHQTAYKQALQKWSDESHASYAQGLVDELETILQTCGDDESRRVAAITTFAEKMAALEHGEKWTTDLDAVFDEDEGPGGRIAGG